ncbi:MAG: SMP-30/gluconolactonase/LRE family protein [Planctomycetota bacterium]|nr:SMP-30/gluconolactonase/LRE family protein [Planctomycetota bacterium]MDA1138675.1 SMP-30/gluconolactonase/LRE family protein [Planctomycetota bacterium]
MSLTAKPILDIHATLGEGALWSVNAQIFYWVDIMEKQVHIYDPETGENRTLDTGQDVGTVVERESGGLMIAIREGFASLNIETGEVKMLREEIVNSVRFNDGKCDPAGRFWAGTMAYNGAKGAGKLYRLDPDFTLHTMLDSVTISNGLVWTSDNSTFYYIDTPTGRVDAYDYDHQSGNISNCRTAVQIPSGQGGPDGMTIDSEDMVWVAHWGGSCVTRWNPRTGVLLETVEVPGAKQITSCALGGPDLDDLYITSASLGLKDAGLEEQPDAGNLFRVKVNAKGVPAAGFKG